MVVPVMLGFVLMVVDAALNPRSSAILLAVPLVGFPVLAMLARLCNYALIPLLGRRTYRQTRAYQEEWSVELTRSGSRARAAGIETFVPWTHYVAWSETNKVILLYQNDSLFQFFPRPKIDIETMQIFRTLVSNLKKR